MSGAGGLSFWLSYVESRGGLWERTGDTALVMVPPQLQRTLELPEELAVTEHADVAREDRVALLEAGHPLLMAAAEDVLSAEDSGAIRLAMPASQRPDDARLLEKARDAFPVDHGRVDARGPAERCLRQVLRVGALVTYTASVDDRFHERAECWLDVPSRHELPAQAVERLRRVASDGSPTPSAPDLGALPPALAAAHRVLDLAAAERCKELADGSVRAAADTERARAQKYYAEALASLTRRQATAPAERQSLLAARVDSLRAEEKRRLAEIEEKYTPRHDLRPYRLHLLYVPALRLPVDVLRGSRRFPLVLEWLLPAAGFAPLRCPKCGANAAQVPLVAAKTHLGCAGCTARAAICVAAQPSGGRSPAVSPPLVPAGPAQRPSAGGGGLRPVPDRSAAAQVAAASGRHNGSSASNSRSAARASAPNAANAMPRLGSASPGSASPGSMPPGARPPSLRPLSREVLTKMGEKVAMEFWSTTSQGNLRAVRRLCAPDSPGAAAVRLFGASGPVTAIGVAPGEIPDSFTSATAASAGSDLLGTCGSVHAGQIQYDYLLRWQRDTRQVAEILPFGTLVSARLPAVRWLFSPGAARMVSGLPEPECDLDPVAIRLWRRVLPAQGLPLTLRCLAAWWRVGDGPQLCGSHRPSVLAAAVHRMVGYRAGQAGFTHDAVAGLHGVAAADSRAVTMLLQARLQLSAEKQW